MRSIIAQTLEFVVINVMMSLLHRTLSMGTHGGLTVLQVLLSLPNHKVMDTIKFPETQFTVIEISFPYS